MVATHSAPFAEQRPFSSHGVVQSTATALPGGDAEPRGAELELELAALDAPVAAGDPVFGRSPQPDKAHVASANPTPSMPPKGVLN